MRRLMRVGFGALLLLSGSRSSVANPVLDWNTTAMEVLILGEEHGIAQSRTHAVIQTAVHDALNAIERRYEPYAFDADEPAASPEAAVAAATRDILVDVVPSVQTQIDAVYDERLAQIPDGSAKTAGIALGQQAASAALALRADDDMEEKILRPYTPPSNDPGVYQPTPPYAPIAVGGGWAELEPFTLVSASQFRPRPPYALRSARWARDYDEVQAIGAENSSTRTPEQSEIAFFWYENSVTGWLRIANTVAAAHGLDDWESARVLALVAIGIADGYVAGFEAKYHYLFWRPITAIPAGETDGNSRTDPDPDWTSYCETPPMPDYPSTHSVLGAAAAKILGKYFGNRTSFTVDSLSLPGVTRSYRSFTQAARENAESRVLCGIHWRTTCTAGVKQGFRVGAYVFRHALRPVRRH